MRREVTFTIEIPDGISDGDALEWLEYQLGAIGGLSLQHPLIDEELEADNVRLD